MKNDQAMLQDVTDALDLAKALLRALDRTRRPVRKEVSPYHASQDIIELLERTRASLANR